MDFAVVKLAGKQYVVSPGQKLEVEGRIADGLNELAVDQVLLTSIAGEIKVGTPLVSGMTLKAKVMQTAKGEKIRVAKFKAKSRYRRVNGFRPYVTILEFPDFSSKKEAAPEAKTPAKKAVKK